MTHAPALPDLVDQTLSAAKKAGADAADVLVLAGKGHEDYQEIMGVRQPFSDLSEANKALAVWEAAHA